MIFGSNKSQKSKISLQISKFFYVYLTWAGNAARTQGDWEPTYGMPAEWIMPGGLPPACTQEPLSRTLAAGWSCEAPCCPQWNPGEHTCPHVFCGLFRTNWKCDKWQHLKPERCHARIDVAFNLRSWLMLPWQQAECKTFFLLLLVLISCPDCFCSHVDENLFSLKMPAGSFLPL